jgi:hypothetical protein
MTKVSAEREIGGLMTATQSPLLDADQNDGTIVTLLQT